MKYIVFFSVFLTTTLSAQLSKFSDRDLYEMGKVWGLIKYYHLAVSQGKTDWDGVLLQSLKDGSKPDVGELMNKWLNTADQSKFDNLVKKDNDCDSITLRNFDISWIKKLRKIAPESKIRLLIWSLNRKM